MNELSGLIFPVGWAKTNGYGLIGNLDRVYNAHAPTCDEKKYQNFEFTVIWHSYLILAIFLATK
jgi:hypothetical protein